MRFNPPPNWPTPPPGWSPPPGWQPDPWWPPPPPDWPLWLPEAPRRHTGLIVGAILAAVAFLAVIGVVVVIWVLPLTKPQPTDEDKIRASVSGLEETYNASDFDGFTGHLCKRIRDELRQDTNWHSDDRWTLTVNSVMVTGETADVSVTNEFDGKHDPETEDITFVREDGEWKACTD